MNLIAALEKDSSPSKNIKFASEICILIFFQKKANQRLK